jgi:hypothetical protein
MDFKNFGVHGSFMRFSVKKLLAITVCVAIVTTWPWLIVLAIVAAILLTFGDIVANVLRKLKG